MRAFYLATTAPVSIGLAILLMVLGVFSFLISGCQSEHDPEFYVPDTRIPEPDWLDTTVAPRLSSHKEMQDLYYAHLRCCKEEPGKTEKHRIFYKACHTAIETHPSDEQLLFECLYSMGPALDRAGRKTLLHRILFFHADHKNAVSDVRRSADRVARVSHQLAVMEFDDGNHELANKIIEDVLDKRLDEIDPAILIAINRVLARHYQTSSPAPTAQQMQKMVVMKNHLKDNWSENPRYKENYARFYKVYRDLTELELTSN